MAVKIINLLYLLTIVTYLADYVVPQALNLNKLCTDNYNRDVCKIIDRNQTYECLEVRSKIECILNIEQGNPQFTIIDPEEAVLAASFVSDNVVVVGEVSADGPPYQTAVVVRKFYNNSFENLRGKRLCHPGFRQDELVTKYVLKELENKIINLNNTFCSVNGTTLLEKELSVLSNFFGEGCRPGPWTDDNAALDKKLKEKFSNLCKLCSDETCNGSYKTPLNDTLKCLIEKGGDVAVTSLNDAEAFFNASDNIANFQYLCPNGSVSDSTRPCTWTNQLNRLIITEKNVANNPKNYLEYHLPRHLGPFVSQSLTSVNLEQSLETLLKIGKDDVLIFVLPVPLKSYVTAKRSIPNIANNTRCQTVVKWCTLNFAEQQKCLWLQQAALNTGLQPVIDCVQSNDNDTVSCLIDVQNGTADLVYVDVTYGYTAVKKGLTSVAYPETDNQDVASIVIAVKANSSITSFKDLKGKSACFPQFGGREWLAFIDTMKSKNIMDKSCDYGKLFSDFVGTSCVPGARSKDYGFDTGNSDKLCQQCIPITNLITAQYCNTDENNKYYGTDGALRCLSDGAGEYAVITLKDIVEYSNKTSQFRILSVNGSVLQTEGLFVDYEDSLTTITAGELVAKKDSPKRDDIISLLRGIEIEFGQNLNKFFKVFERFNGTDDLLFPDSTPGLTFEEGDFGKYVDNFKTLLRNSEQCAINPSSASAIIPSTIFMVFVMLIANF